MDKMTDEAIVESLKSIAVKGRHEPFISRVLTNAIYLILRLQDENRRYAEEVNALHDCILADYQKAQAEVNALVVENELLKRELRCYQKGEKMVEITEIVEVE